MTNRYKIRAPLSSPAAGRKTGPAVDKFAALPADNKKRGHSDQADYFQTMVDKATLGDPSEAELYHEQNP